MDEKVIFDTIKFAKFQYTRVPYSNSRKFVCLCLKVHENSMDIKLTNDANLILLTAFKTLNKFYLNRSPACEYPLPLWVENGRTRDF